MAFLGSWHFYSHSDLGIYGRLRTQSRRRGRPGLARWSRCSQPDFGDLHTATVGHDASCFDTPAVIAIRSCVGEKEFLRLEALSKAGRNVADRCDRRPGATLVAGEIRVI